MNAIQIFAFIVLPLSIAAFGTVVAFLYGRGGANDAHGHEPGE